jgi:hypothetical protein
MKTADARCEIIAREDTIMVTTTLELEDETAQILERLAREQNRPTGEVIREALAVYSGSTSFRTIRGSGAYHSGRSDVSEKAEELLRASVRERPTRR